MKIQRTIAAATLTLICSAMAIAAPKVQTPTKLAGGPQSRANCPVPTLAQCKDPEFLENDRCGQLERLNQWTCSDLLKGAMETARSQQGETYSVVPRSFDAEGVGKVVKGGSESGKPYYTPDLYSFTSQQAARDYQAAAPVLGVNKYEQFAANKNVVESCEEYAFEKFYDVSEFSRRVGAARGDHVEALKIAYGPGGDPASIGTRHLGGAKLKGKDGRVFGAMLEGTRAKNAFFAIPSNPALKGREPVPAAPNLVLSLYNSGAAALLAKTYAAATVPNTWSAHNTYAQSLLFIPPASAPKTLALAPQPDDPGGFKAAFGTTGGEHPKRKRIAKELDELYDLQERFRAGFDAWARLNERYAGSGWSYVLLDPDGAGHGGGGGQTIDAIQAKKLAPAPPAPNDKLAPKPNPGVTPGFAVDLAIENPETVARKKVLKDLVDLMEKGDEEGCFDSGTTACDWSPKLFARAVRNTFADEQDAAFEQCNAFTKGSIANVKNLDEHFVDDPKYPQFTCILKTDDTITAKDLDDMALKVDECRLKRVAYNEKKAADEALAAIEAAKARVQQIPELAGDKTGEFKKPGLTKSRDGLMGGDKFGMGYSYDFGFLFDAHQEVCNLEIEAHGGFNTYANVFGKRFDIIDALARFSTEDREVKVHAKFAGKNLFTPVDEEWKDYDPSFTWSLAKTVGSGKKSYSIFKSWIVVVVIPVKIEAGISGEAGLNLGLKADAQGFDNKQCPSARIAGLAEPFVQIDGYLEAGIDIFVASVGIRGSLTIVRASLPFTAGVGVEIAKKDAPLLDPSRMKLFADTRMDLKLTTLSGAISVYGQVGFCPFCIRGEKEIASFEGPSYETNIFKQKYDVNLKDLGIALGLN